MGAPCGATARDPWRLAKIRCSEAARACHVNWWMSDLDCGTVRTASRNASGETVASAAAPRSTPTCCCSSTDQTPEVLRANAFHDADVQQVDLPIGFRKRRRTRLGPVEIGLVEGARHDVHGAGVEAERAGEVVADLLALRDHAVGAAQHVPLEREIPGVAPAGLGIS